MAQQTVAADVPASLRALGETLLALMGSPAALVVDGTSVLALNAGWQEATGCRSCAAGSLTLAESLPGFSRIEALVTPLQAGTQSVGATTLLGPAETGSTDDPCRRRFVVRWRQAQLATAPCTYATAVVLDASDLGQDLVSIIDSQHVRINQLLVRQTLIEERERGRLGRALHDDIAQHLAVIRGRLQSARRASEEMAALVVELDGVIAAIRDLVFELSPPILEDLGMLPALHWLADELSQRYGVRVELVDDHAEPPLSHPARTIVFRAMRELAANAAKNADCAEITLFSEVRAGAARLGVGDAGRGFNANAAAPPAHGLGRFGLLSVEQQIRAIGGSLEIVSNVGAGTRATITIACPGDGAAHE